MGRGLAQEHRSGMGSALGCLGRRCRAGSMALDGEAALGVAARRRRERLRATWVVLGLKYLAQKRGVVVAWLTEV